MEVSQSIFFIQAFGTIFFGSFLGELWRFSKTTDDFLPLQFFTALFAGGFLAFLVSYTIYHYRADRPLAVIVGGFLGFLDVDTVLGYISRLVEPFIKMKGEN